MNAVKKILIEAPLRGASNAVASMVKDRLYQGKRYQRTGELGDVWAGLVSGLEQAAPVIIKWFLVGVVIYYGLKMLEGKIGKGEGDLAGCRCVEWRCD